MLSPKKLRLVLFPISKVYGAIVAARNYCFDKSWFRAYKAALPVIGVGNVTVGGSGKSPFADYLVRHLATCGVRPVILSRGYRGQKKGPHLVSLDNTAEEVGDEALMHLCALEKKGKVVISRQRVAGARFIARNNLADIIVLDDGFAHRKLARDLDIVLVDISGDISGSTNTQFLETPELLPLGEFREEPRSAFKRASAVVYIKRCLDMQEQSWNIDACKLIPPHIPTFRFVLVPDKFVDCFSGVEYSLDNFASKSASAITAIAKPDGFFRILRELGIVLENTLSCRDHHVFSAEQWNSFAAVDGNMAFTTSKDAVKLRRFLRGSGELFVLSLKGSFVSTSEQEDFWKLTGGVIEHKGRGRNSLAGS